MEITTTQEILLFMPVLCAIILFFGATYATYAVILSEILPIQGSNATVPDRSGRYSVLASKYDLVENNTSYTSEFLCSAIVDPPQHATIISKDDSVASNNYWRTEYQLVLTDINNTHNGPKAHLPNNATMSTTKTGNIPLSGNINLHAKRHIFDGLHSDSLISLVQLCDDKLFSIFDNNEINILKDSKIILKVHRNKSDRLWDVPI